MKFHLSSIVFALFAITGPNLVAGNPTLSPIDPNLCDGNHFMLYLQKHPEKFLTSKPNDIEKYQLSSAYGFESGDMYGPDGYYQPEMWQLDDCIDTDNNACDLGKCVSLQSVSHPGYYLALPNRGNVASVATVIEFGTMASTAGYESNGQSAHFCMFTEAGITTFYHVLEGGFIGKDTGGSEIKRDGEDEEFTMEMDESCQSNNNGGANGDPHVTLWNGDKYDFHGACDLILLQSPNFANGLGLAVHIRTKSHSWWSSIETALVRVGDNTVEVMGSNDGSASYWANGGNQMEVQDLETTLGDYPMKMHRITDHQVRIRIDLGNGDAISLETFKHFVRVNVKGKTAANFEGSSGLMGSYPHGKMVARDGTTILNDPVEFGQNWQVLDTEPMLFHNRDGVQHPEQCAMPSSTVEAHRRRLGQSAITHEDAALACARVEPKDRDACIFDVLATNDKEIAGSY